MVKTFDVGLAVHIQHKRGIKEGGAKVPVMRFPGGKRGREICIIDHKIMMSVPSTSNILLRNVI